MVELALNSCTLTVLPANPSLVSRLRLKVKGKSIEWRCPECGAKNSIKVSNLPYEFAGGDSWSRVIRSSAYLTQLSKIAMSKRSLISFLAEKVKLEKKYLGKNSKPKLSASTRVEESCSKCGAKATFNVELSSNINLFPENMEHLTLEGLKIEIIPEDSNSILNRLLRGFNIYFLMKEFSLGIDIGNLSRIRADKRQLENLKKLSRRIESLKNDMEKAQLFDRIRMEIEKLTGNFQTNEALIYISDMLSFIKRMKNSMVKNFRKQLFLSLAQLEEQIENITLKLY